MIGAFRSAAMGRPAPAGYRYWRLIMTDDNHQTNQYKKYIAAWEIEMFASDDATGTDLTAGATASAQSCYDNNCTLWGPQLLIDNNTNTAFYSKSDPSVYQWIDIDFASAVLVKSIKITHMTANNLLLWGKAFDVQSSDDGTNWTTRASLTTTNATTDKTVRTYTW